MGLFKKKNIINIEILDGSTTSHKSTGSSIARGVVGGAMFGGVGAIVGAMNGREKQKTMITFLISYDDGTTDTIPCEYGGAVWDMYNRKMNQLNKNK